LALQNRKPVRFAEIISMTHQHRPLEVFIRSGMTNYIGAIKTGTAGSGPVFGSFAADSRGPCGASGQGNCKRIGLGGCLTVGRPGQTVLDVPVNEAG